ncbi:heme NO-binding domain-containing protein [Sagittula sp. SSi028]|uniref:heme NO-binding domain-containing protein n=1 Tax=Sagittula sp. SSi028 TaxID=3400636 RepID=UPI003AF667C6
MKGTIFTELVKMAEDAFGEDTVDMVLESADLENGGAYTTVGNYPCSELIKIVMAFSAHSGLSPEVLQRKFGHWMLDYFVANFPEFFAEKTDTFGLLESVDGEIHVEVKKLYPDAELPRFDTERPQDGQLDLIYSSPRPLDAFCHGIVEASLAHFGQTGEITRTPADDGSGATRFTIKLAA